MGNNTYLSMLRIPRVTINLWYYGVRNVDPFYERVTRTFYHDARKRHPKFPLIRSLTYGVALCCLGSSSESYFARIESSGRRNIKKARRLGYQFEVIDYNAYLDDIRLIRQSTKTRQGELSSDFLNADVVPCRNPEPLTTTHAYPYYGVYKDDHLYAYAGVLIAGELAIIEHIYGHAAHQSDGIVPLLFAGLAEKLTNDYPAVKYYGYGSYYGASESMRRFKRKFLFMPHRVKWELGDT